MNYRGCKEDLREVVEEYSIYLDQNLRMLELLENFDILTNDQKKQSTRSLIQLKKSFSTVKKDLERQGYNKQLILSSHQIIDLLLEMKDYEERLLEILGNKVQFPTNSVTKALIEYFICELDIELFLNTKFRHKIYSVIFVLAEGDRKSVV